MATADNSLLSLTPLDFKRFRALIHDESGIWLRDGKEVMLASRLARRLRLLDIATFSDYYDYVERVNDGGEELGALINCVTTNKTSFFRESHHFDFLADTLVPEVLAAARGGVKSVRVWSACCSTGEEPYSIAISLLEAVAKSPSPALGGWDLDVVASDIDTVVLATAARGVYPDDSLESVPRPLWEKYFLRGKGDMEGQVKLKREVTGIVHFQHLNLMDAMWPLEGLFNMIFCRNALIYFNRDTQEVFLRKMLRYLKPGGYLALGHSEHVPWLNDAVIPLNHTIHQLRDPGKPRESARSVKASYSAEAAAKLARAR